MEVKELESKDRLNVYLPTRLKRRLKNIAEDKDVKMNDLVIQAVNDLIDHMDASHSAPDEVLDRLNQVLNSQIAVVTAVNKLSDKLDEHESR